jgi:hypothetical protein
MKLLLLLLLFPLFSLAQNLVPNPSFEHYDSCPDFYSELSYATGWLAFSPSPDYFNSCDLSQFVGCNKNFAGMQNPYIGSGYAGIETFSSTSPNAREIIGRQLLTTLTQGVKYYVSAKISLADSFSIACNKFGFAFSTIKYNDSTS